MLPMPLIQLILMLKISLWMPYKVLRIKLKVLQITMLKIGQNVPMQPPQQPGPVGPVVPAQPAPVQPGPVGPVVPAPQVFYQNWTGKKPEFSGKPEEDAESHLLSTRDWMEAHNFPDEVKVRHFCLTLTGETRLWYESLAL